MPTTVIATYRVPLDQEDAFRALLASHWPTLDGLGLVSGDGAVIYRGQENEQPIYREIFTWADGGAEKAHQMPEVMAIWEPMGALCEGRGEGRPALEFPEVSPVSF